MSRGGSWLGVDVRGYLTGGRCLGVVARGIDVRGYLIGGRCPGVVSWGGARVIILGGS